MEVIPTGTVSQTPKQTRTHTYTHLMALFPGLPRWTGTNLAFTEATHSEWQWHQLGHMQVCISLQTDNHASTPPLSFFTGRMPFLSPNQQRQSTEGTKTNTGLKRCLSWHTDHHNVDNLLWERRTLLVLLTGNCYWWNLKMLVTVDVWHYTGQFTTLSIHPCVQNRVVNRLPVIDDWSLQSVFDYGMP